jgi:hypothetical protein
MKNKLLIFKIFIEQKIPSDLTVERKIKPIQHES